VLLWLPFLGPVAEGLKWLSPTEVPRQIANAHTFFNLVNALVFIGFAPQLARLVEALVPERPLSEADRVEARYLDLDFLVTPSLALDRARLELLHVGEQLRTMLRAVLPALLAGSREELEEVARMDDAVDRLHGQIVTYLGKVSETELNEAQSAEIIRLLEAANDLESIGDVIELNLVALGRERLSLGVTISPRTREVIEGFHEAVTRSVELALVAVAQKNRKAANLVLRMDGEIDRLESSAVLHEARRLVAREPNRLPAYTVETDVLKNLKRIYYFARRMARRGTPVEGESGPGES
jgi:phosphate:Na+ symporter